MKLFSALAVALSIPASFAIGAWAQDHRVRDYYLRQGRIAAYYEVIGHGRMLYLTCIEGGCVAERRTSETITQIVNPLLENEGVAR